MAVSALGMTTLKSLKENDFIVIFGHSVHALLKIVDSVRVNGDNISRDKFLHGVCVLVFECFPDCFFLGNDRLLVRRSD